MQMTRLTGKIVVYTDDQGILTASTTTSLDHGGRKQIAAGDDIIPLTGWGTAAMRQLYDSVGAAVCGYVGCNSDGSVNGVNA